MDEREIVDSRSVNVSIVGQHVSMAVVDDIIYDGEAERRHCELH